MCPSKKVSLSLSRGSVSNISLSPAKFTYTPTYILPLCPLHFLLPLLKANQAWPAKAPVPLTYCIFVLATSASGTGTGNELISKKDSINSAVGGESSLLSAPGLLLGIEGS